MEYENLPIRSHAGTDTDRGDCQLRCDPGAQLRWDALEHDGKAAEILQAVSLTNQPGRVGPAPALHTKATELVDPLRCQADVSHDRYARTNDMSDHLLVAFDSFELYGLCAVLHEGADRVHR